MSSEVNAQYQYSLENVAQAVKDNPSPIPAALGIAIAQTQATLGLIFEQRTANLIALFAQGFAGENNFLDMTLGEEGYQEAARQIKQRLGLGD